MPFEPKVDVDEDCLICCEPLNHDLNFYPCPCEFQLCSMCWHRIKNDEDNKCPNCREPYGDEPYKWGPLTPEQEVALKELRSKEQNSSSVSKPKPAVAPTIASVELNRDRLAHVRVMQKNLVFVVGLSTQIAQEQVLRRTEYFGKYGKILKVAVNQSTAYAGTQGNSFTLKSKDLGPSASAYVTYNTTDAALKCIQEVNGSYQDGRTLKATLGTTKYCSRFLNGQQCKLTDCMYLHEVAEEEASFTKDDMSKQKHSEYEKSLMDAFIRRQREKHEKEIKTRALAKAQAEADARMKAEMQKQKNRQRAEADKKAKETSPTTSSTPPLAKTSRPNNPPLGGNSSASSTNTSSAMTSSSSSSMTSSTNMGIPGQANHKQKKEKPKTKKEIENEKKRSKIQKQIDESEEEKEEEEVKDAWDSSDEEIENDSKVTTPPPTANQRTGSQTETANQKQEKPQTTPPPKVTTPTPNNVATTNGAKDNKKEKTKSQKQNLETKENHKKSQKHKITNETSVPKTDKGEQKVPESVKQSQAQNEPKPEPEKKRKSPPAVTSSQSTVTSSVTKSATQVSTTVSTTSSQSSVRNNDDSSSPSNQITSNTLAMSVASVIAERILTPSPPVHNDTRMEDPFRLTMERSREQRNSSEHKPAGSGSGFDPFSLGPSSVGPDRFSPFGSVQNGVGLDRNGPDRTETNSRPHSNHSSNSGGQTGSISGLGGGPSFGVGNSLLSSLEKARPSPPGISTNQIPSGPPGLGVSQIGSGPQKLDLGNSLPTRPPTLQSKSHFDPFDFKKPTVIQGLSNGGPGLGVSGRTGTGLPNGKGPFSLPSPFGSGPTGAGHGEGPGLNLPFPKPSQPMDFRSQPPPPGLGHLSERAKNDLDWLPDHSFSRFRQNDFDQRSRNHFPPSNSDPFRGFHNGFGGMENGIGRPKRPEPKEDDLGFDPSQFALDQLDLTRNKLNDMNLNPRQPNKPRNEHWNQPNSFNSGYGQSNHSNLFSDFGLRGGQPTHSHGPRAPPTQTLGDLRNSQDMLRRLLPNVNVSFNNESSMDNFGRNNYSQVRNPPPGFGQYQPDTPANGPHLPSNLLDFD